MTRSLLVLRHGKSDWNADYAEDHDRPLKRRGHRAAATMGRLMTTSKSEPDLVLSSSALRARSTAEIAYAAGSWTCPIEFSRELYDASAETILERLRTIPEKVGRVLVVGHEPTCSETVSVLCSSAPPAFPTAGLARIDLDIGEWGELSPGSGQLVFLIPPKAIEGWNAG